MSAGTSGDVSLIKDEDLLRKMWQDTEDFGRKKEIRAHMYKLREARLRDFYNSGEVNTDIQKSTTTTTESKSYSGSTHADSLADHSFISMKTKEIRDSESPTKDDLYRVTDKGFANQGWTVVTSNKRSDDGKTFNTSKIATTAGTDKIEGGKIDYAAKNEQHASVYKDGDDKNFTKSVGSSSNTLIKQEATGGDKNSSFKSSSTKTSSSSKVVTEQRSTSGDIVQSQTSPSKMITQGQNDDYLISRKIYTENIPNEFKNHPNYVDGKTKVTRETRTLPDGSTVTTTKYEIKGGNTTQSSKSSQYSTSEQSSSSSLLRSSQAVESKNIQNESRTIQYSSDKPTNTATTTVTRYIHDSRDKPATTSTTSRTTGSQQMDFVDGVSRSTNVYESKNQQQDMTVIRKMHDSKEPLTSQDINTTTTTIKQVYNPEPIVTQDSNVTRTTTVIKKVYDSRNEPTVTKDTRTTVIKNVQEPCIPDNITSVHTAVTKNISDVRNQAQATDNSNVVTTKTTLIKNIYDVNDRAQTTDDSKSIVTGKTTVTKQSYDFKDDKSFINEQSTNKVNKNQVNEVFINVEKQDFRNRVEPAPPAPEGPRPESSEKRPILEPKRETPEKRPKPDEKYNLPEKRQLIKPGKPELDTKTKPTEGQYETTYRTDFTNKRISVDVSPTHDVFARSLRAVSPDRISKCSSPSRSLRTSTSSLRNSTSPEKNRHPSRLSPERRSISPRKATSNETITYKNRVNTDTLTRKTHTTEVDSGTLTRKKNKPQVRSRSPSPTTTASEIEFIGNTNIVTDLDTNETTIVTQLRPSSLEITNKHTKKITERSPTSPLTDGTPKKTTTRTNSLRTISPTKETSGKVFKRTDTYEERCRQILGITSEKDKSTQDRIETRRVSGPKITPSSNKGSPTRNSPEKKTGNVPSQTKKSPEKQPFFKSPERKSPIKDSSKINEFPSQVRRSPEKQPLGKYPEKKNPVKYASKLNEFPSQIRKSPEKELLGPYPGKKSPVKDKSQLNEFPSQIKKNPEKELLEPYPEKKSPVKGGPKINEYPSQVRHLPTREPFEAYPEKTSPQKEHPKLNEFPSQIRKTPEKELLEPYPEKKSPVKGGPKINEYPSQVRHIPTREPLEAYPKKTSPQKEHPKLNEFPSQIRKTPEKELLEPYPEKKGSVKEAPKINEFPSQIRHIPTREPLGAYPERTSPQKEHPNLNQFPSQIRKSPEKEPLGTYPERKSPQKEQPKLNEFPAQITKSPEKEPLRTYPEKKSPVKEPSKTSEFPSQIRRSPETKSIEPYSERTRPQTSEFPYQIRPDKDEDHPNERSKMSPMYRYPLSEKDDFEKPPSSESEKISKIPSRRIPDKEDDYLKKQVPSVTDFDFTKQPTEEQSVREYPKRPTDKTVVDKLHPSDVCLFPTRSPEHSEPGAEKTVKEIPTKTGQPSQTKKSPQEKPQISEFPSQIRRSPEKVPLEKYPEKIKPQRDNIPQTRDSPQIRKVSEKETQEKIKPKSGTYEPKKPPQHKQKSDLKTRQKTESESSSSTDEEEATEQLFQTTVISELEGRVPVDEPLATKKFISQLCREEEIERSDLTKHETQIIDENELTETRTKSHKTVKKESAKKPEELFIEKEKIDINKQHPKPTSPTKKSTTEKNTTTKKLLNTVGTKIDNKIVKKVTDEKFRPKDVKKTTEKITLYDIENMNSTREDNRTHVRTHRVDDTIHKNVSKATVNGNISKKEPIKRPQPIKSEEPKTKKSTDRSPQPLKSEDVKTKKPLDKKTHKSTSKTVIETESKRTITEQKTPKRHIVTTTITVTPTTKPSPVKSPKKSKPVTKTTKPIQNKPKLQNGNDSSDDESVTETEEVTKDIFASIKKKNIRITSDQITKKKFDRKTPVKIVPQAEVTSSKTKQEKCITTKSIIINNDVSEREVIVDLQRSKSSREPTPDRVCPLPVSEDDDSIPRYPDQISEPDDVKPKPRKLIDIPILEGEDVVEFSRITEIRDTSKTNVDQIQKTDISLSTIDKKINKFSDTTGTEKVARPKQGPAPKVDRPKLEVTEDLKSDECLLSVSEKVNKFITTAEQLTAPQDLPPRPKSPKCRYYPEEEVNVSDKVSHFITTAEKVITTPKVPAPKVERPCFDDVDETIKEDECLLSVSDKVNKFIKTTDELTADSKKAVSLSKIDIKTSVSKPHATEETPRRSPTKDTTPTRKPSNQYSSIKRDTEENKYPRRDSSPKLPNSTPRSTRRPSTEEPRPSFSPTGRLRSTETVKKAKALFENINKDQQTVKQRDILSRPSVFESRKVKTETSRKLEYAREEEEQKLKSTKLLLEKVRSRPKSPEKVQEIISRRSLTPEGDIPGYMRPLDRSLRPNSPHRESINQLNKKHTIIRDDDDDDDDEDKDLRHTKFGVSLKRTDSGRNVTSRTIAKSTISVEGLTEARIEAIFELEVLEELLERVVSYELRRKIRTQIRLVKQLISEGKLSEITKTTITRERSPAKTTRQSPDFVETTEYHSSYAYNERRSSSEYTKTTRQSQSPETKSSRLIHRSPSPEIKQSKIPRRSQSPEMKPTRKGSDTKLNREKTPDKSQPKTTKIFQTQLKKSLPSTKPSVADNTPEWAKQRNLRKVTDTTVTTTRNSTTTSSKKSRSSPAKESKPIDSITSSYGVGPTDENGSPLFGLKALRVQNKADTTKVQGTVIRSQYYSENGKEPVGEISVTKYSSDPRDLGRHDDVKTKGITSITTTQKFGYKDTPLLKNLTETKKKKEICEGVEDVIETKRSSKVTRRGSVKTLSQKFIDNAVETSKNEKQSSYPKAGLILRTSSFKESASSGDSREGSAERTATIKTSSTRTVTGETFLTNRSKVTGVQDVISRMKSEDIREGDSAEDVEARGLLNKFLGAQVILSGIESNVKTSSTTTTTNAKRSTKVTTTVTERGKPVTKTRVFQHPVTDEDLQTVWDEQTLRLLLEQSTDYEERRKIRARLRQVMAEQEACTELVDKASQDQISTTFEGATHTKKSFTEEPVTTSQVTTRVTTTQQAQSKKPISPFAKFRQLDKQNSLNSPSTPKTPSGSGPLFKFTDPAVSQSASTIKDRLLHWCRMKTKEYENIQLDNFSTSWADGLAFCALIHHFLPEAFDYHALSPKNRRHNFTLAFQVADEKADIAPLLDVDDMVATRKPDWKCVFTYVQSIYRRFKDED